MTKRLMLSALPLLMAAPLALAQQPARTWEGFSNDHGVLQIRTSDGVYRIRPYSANIVETTFIPNGQTWQPQSHAVVMQPLPVDAKIRDSAAALEYATPGITVTVVKAPFDIRYSYKGKPLLAEKGGYTHFAPKTTAPDGKPLEHAEPDEALSFRIDPNEALYGGGARALGMDRRGNRLQLYNRAHYGYEDRAELMNFTMPLVLSSKLYAVHFDNPEIGYLDLDSKKDNTLAYETIGGRKTYQVIADDSWAGLIRDYTQLTGRQPMPPRWALGNFASRFGYHTEAEARATVAKFEAAHIPLDAIIFDLYWFGPKIQGSMGNLAFDKHAFPTPKQMIADFNAKGVKTVLITEPFVLTTSDRWHEAEQAGVLAKGADGKPFTYDFYFGHTGLIDVFDPKARDWFWHIYKDLTQQGVAGWWGDLGEPEVHPAALHHVNGTADEVHNIYGNEWAKMVADGFRRDFPQQRPFILMRAGYSGAQRFGMIPWSGDVNRSWGGLQSQPEIALEMGMQGVGYMHSDLGGFANPNLDNELYTRWLQYGVFQPIFRPHAQEEVPAEPVYREPHTEALAKAAIELRYRMLPYNYTLAFDNHRTGIPLMRPLVFEEPANPKLQGVSDTYLWGDAFLVAPVLQKGMTARNVYFPDTANWYDFYTDQKYKAGTTASIAMQSDRIPVFVRAGAFVPLTQVVQTTRDYSTKDIELHYYHDVSVAQGSGMLYDDDGLTADAYEHGQYELLHFRSQYRPALLTIALDSENGAQHKAIDRHVALQVHNVDSKPKTVLVDHKAVPFKWSQAERKLTVPLQWRAGAHKEIAISLANPRADL